jgi:hypothetical protein
VQQVTPKFLGRIGSALVVKALDALLPGKNEKLIDVLRGCLRMNHQVQALALIDELLASRGLNDDLFL